ncbi:MAG: DUF3791 domain-containing protein [Lachnospiraceae bacterium]|nr:DUF3791 domain-containing protein [Lachnospiraceae bacterium]
MISNRDLVNHGLILNESEEWQLSLDEVLSLFKQEKVLDYIEKAYGIFHCEEDEAVLQDIKENPPD